MKQTIEIEVPDGFVAKYNSDDNRIELVKKDTKPKTWEEYYHNNLYKSFAFSVEFLDCDGDPYVDICLDSREEADAFIALMQLRQLRQAWVEDWKPIYTDICNPNPAWHIHYEKEQVVVDSCTLMQRTLSFPTREMAKEFLKCFKELIEKAKILL